MNNHNLFYKIILDICHARTPTYKWRYFPWRTKENEPIQTKYRKQFIETRLFQVTNVILNFLSPGTLLKLKTNKGLKPSKL